jgi:predicted GIY-YIG superfamily endonuclease
MSKLRLKCAAAVSKRFTNSRLPYPRAAFLLKIAKGSSMGKTIRLFLIDNSPLGLISAEIMNWTGKVLSFPRGLLPEALKRLEVSKTGIYFLVGPDPNNPCKSQVYIGESDDIAKRLKQHDKDETMEFFEQAALVVSKDDNLTKSHARYIEASLINIVRKIGLATLKNGNLGSPVMLPEAERSDMEYILKQLQVLMPVLGYSFLQETPSSKQQQYLSPTDSAITLPTFELIAEGGELYAEAQEIEGQFIVLPGARVRWENTLPETLGGYDFQQEKQTLYNQGQLSLIENTTYMLNTEKLFKSPSAASCFIRHRRQYNGRTDWKLKTSGITYGEWRKAQVEAATNAGS